MSAYTPIVVGDSLADLPVFSERNLRAIRSLHWSPDEPANPVEGMLWSDPGGVTAQRIGAAWVPRWITGLPIEAAPKAQGGSFSFNSKRTVGFMATRIALQVRRDVETGDPTTIRTSTMMVFYADGEETDVTRPIGVQTNTTPAYATVDITCEIEDDGFTVQRSADLGNLSLRGHSAIGRRWTRGPDAMEHEPLPHFADASGVAAVSELFGRLNTNDRAVRGHGFGDEQPTDLQLGMLWAKRDAGVVYQLVSLSPSPVWAPVAPLGLALTPLRFKKLQTAATINNGATAVTPDVDTTADGFTPASEWWEVGFTPRAVEVNLAYRARGEQASISEGPFFSSDTMLFTAHNQEEPLAVARNAAVSALPDMVEVLIKAEWTTTGVRVSKSGGSGTALGTVKCLGVKVIGD